MQMARNLVTGFALLSLVAPLLACEEELNRFEAPSQKALSPLGRQERRDLHVVLDAFHGGPTSRVSLLGITDVLTGELRRYFVDAYASGSAVVVERSLDLTSGAIFPEMDSFGNFMAGQGWASFEEMVHDESGEVISHKEIHKPLAQFTKGSVRDYSYFDTKESEDVDSVRDLRSQSFTIASDLAYSETFWHQQKSSTLDPSTGRKSSETYAYQSHPLLLFSLKAGDTYKVELKTWDSVEGTAGWDIEALEREEYSLHGTLTLFQPVEEGAEENVREAAALAEPKVTTSGNRQTEVTEFTSVDESEQIEGGFILKKTRVTTTKGQTVVKDTETGKPLERTEMEHESRRVTYTAIPGMEAEATRVDFSRIWVDYVETEITTIEIEYQWGSGSDDGYVTTTTTTTLRYTDNPKTKNDIWTWRSTQEVKVETGVFEAPKGYLGEQVQDAGTRWLVERIEVDPDYNAVPFTFEGYQSKNNSTVVRFIEAIMGGLRRTDVGEEIMDFRVSLGNLDFSLNGHILTSLASISDVNGVSHFNGNDVDGVIEVKTSGTTASVSAEEWTEMMTIEQ